MRDYGQVTGARIPYELASQFPANMMSKSDLHGKCKTCCSLRVLVPQAASVVEELYEDISIALKDRIPDRHEVKTMNSSLISSVMTC